MGRQDDSLRCKPAIAILLLVLAWTTLVPRMGGSRQAGAAAATTLPPGYRLYASKVLPYSIGYPSSWVAEGSIWGSHKSLTYYEEDVFEVRKGANFFVQGETLPAGSLLTSEAYGELRLLQLLRNFEQDSSNSYTARRLGTIAIDGATAYLFDINEFGIESTDAVWVARDRGWDAAFRTLPGAGHLLLVPTFLSVIQTFKQR